MKPFYASMTPKELRDSWGTPDSLWLPMHEKYKFALDAAATEHNTRCAMFLPDGLAFNWADVCPPNMSVWCNPPFSNVTPWVDQWILCAESGRQVVVIVNSQTGAIWYHKCLEAATEIQYSRGRVGFIRPDTGKPDPNNNLGQTVFVFTPNRLGEQLISSFHAKHYYFNR